LGRDHSRRQADSLVEEGRVTVNGLTATLGMRVDPSRDVVHVDGAPLSDLGGVDERDEGQEALTHGDDAASPPARCEHEYIVYWKPVGITCTCDARVPGNLVEALRIGDETKRNPRWEPALRRRVFPVGRLDRDTSGLLLLTSDGSVPNAVLRGEFAQPKTYRVTLDRPIRPEDVRELESGVVITTETSRRRRRRRPAAAAAAETDEEPSSAYRRTVRTARTRPAQVKVRGERPNELFITIREGRNRQVRKMAEAVGYRAIRLHRTEFVGLSLDRLDGPGDWRRLSEGELAQLFCLIYTRDAAAALDP
jgi:pseudouridine synthase